MRATLVLFRGEERLLAWPLRGGRVALGRADTCDLVIPDEAVSRIHCVLTERAGRWSLQDNSRHGTTVNETPVVGQVDLREADVIGVCGYTLRFSQASPAPRTSTQTRRASPAVRVLGSWRGPAVEGVALVAESGPAEGQRWVLTRRRQGVGGPGSRVEVPDPRMAPNHFFLVLVRGRPLIEPGDGITLLDGERLWDPTPLYPDDRVRAGDTVLRIERALDDHIPEATWFGELVGESALSRRLFGTLKILAGCEYPVLIQGEPGTGKEEAARGLHTEGPRADGPFVPLNCGALPEALIESELFGHEKGAFTGASSRRDGAFLQAAGGTLFLDEIGEMPLLAQGKLLRVLQTGEVRRVSGDTVLYPDVRVIAATNRDLAAEVQAGRFRRDLLFRINALEVRLPSLRERPEDIPVIARALCARMDGGVRLSGGAIEALRAYSFPDNVRELRNVLVRARVFGGPTITRRHITFSGGVGEVGTPTDPEAAERRLLVEALERHGGNRSATARELGIPRSTLLYRMGRYGLMG
ncbi:MAG: sigma 54-interacting transcriptional regulator [Alphaproteobacteria bacterium]|nr:sigma 54-interacting transcriptional regulator [Alphaproteobacteria bacterium]